MIDFDKTYQSEDIRSELYFSSYGDNPGCVELHLPGEHRTIKMTAAAAEDLQTNLSINTEFARHGTTDAMGNKLYP